MSEDHKSQVKYLIDSGGEPNCVYVEGHVSAQIFLDRITGEALGDVPAGEFWPDGVPSLDVETGWWRWVDCYGEAYDREIQEVRPEADGAFPVTYAWL